MQDYDLYHKRLLPHIQPQRRPLFVTFRSADPIPTKFIHEYNRYKESLDSTEKQQPDDRELKINNNKKAFAMLDEIYNHCQGEIDFVKSKAVANTISENLRTLHGSLCYIYAYTIMSNHLHLLLLPEEQDGKPISLAEIMKKFKGLTARQVNLILNRSESLWSREYYDHWVRNDKEFENIVEYIRQNPVKAGLVKEPEDWPWTCLNLEGMW